MPTPAENLQALLNTYQQGNIDVDTFLLGLGHFEVFVTKFQERMMQIVCPDDFELGPVMLECATSCFGNYLDAIGLLREYAQTGDSELVASASKLTAEADAALSVLVEDSKQHAESSVSLDALGG